MYIYIYTYIYLINIYKYICIYVCVVAPWQEWCPNRFEVVAAKCRMHGFQMVSFSFQKNTGSRQIQAVPVPTFPRWASTRQGPFQQLPDAPDRTLPERFCDLNQRISMSLPPSARWFHKMKSKIIQKRVALNRTPPWVAI